MITIVGDTQGSARRK